MEKKSKGKIRYLAERDLNIFEKRYNINWDVRYKLLENWKKNAINGLPIANDFLHSEKVQTAISGCDVKFDSIFIHMDFGLYKIFSFLKKKGKFFPYAERNTTGKILMNGYYILAAAGALTGDIKVDHDVFLITLFHEIHHDIRIGIFQYLGWYLRTWKCEVRKLSFGKCKKAIQELNRNKKFIRYCEEIRSDVLAFRDLRLQYEKNKEIFTTEYEEKLLKIREGFDADPTKDGATHPSRKYRSDCVRCQIWDDNMVYKTAMYCGIENKEFIKFVQNFYKDKKDFDVN